MAVYKVPQDVEADDKLIGPFSFRQFIYLIIVALAGAMAWGLAQISIVLVAIPLPVILLFGALALPLRKDQPMEIYLAAMISFYLKPRRRMWDPDGVESLIEITAPRVVEVSRVKDITQSDAEQRLSYLANIVDSQGWAIRGVGSAPGTAMNNDVLLEAQGAQDILDTNTSVAQSFDMLMNQRTEQVREEAIARMQQATFAPTPAPAPVVAAPAIYQTPQQQVQPVYTAPYEATQTAFEQPVIQPHFDPYPSIQQTIIQPLSQQSVQPQSPAPTAAPVAQISEPAVISPQEPPATTSETVVSAGIMNLANNSDDLSVETIAHEAHRLAEKAKLDEQEVVISLR